MKIDHFTNIPALSVNDEAAKAVSMRVLISKEDNPPNFIMRLFHVEPNGFTPYHSHNWEHEVFVTEGSGVLVTINRDIPIQPGTAIFIKPNEEHQFKNSGNTRLSFLCMIPVDISIDYRIFE